jgi:VWFA-related protein
MPSTSSTPTAGRNTGRIRGLLSAAFALGTVLLSQPLIVGQQASPKPDEQAAAPDQPGFTFRSGVDVVNVTATVTDRDGRFVPSLSVDDFRVYEDGELQEISYFSSERVPVSLGVALDTSGSMAGDKIVSAQSALDRFIYDLLDRDDELFLYEIADPPRLLQDWTTDRRVLSAALRGIRPRGGTAMYDAVAEAVPMAQDGHNRKKALVVISDGNDTASRVDVTEVKGAIRETEVMVYAIAIDGRGEPTLTRGPSRAPRRPFPIPMPGGRGRGPSPWPTPPPLPGSGPWSGGGSGGDGGVNVSALREMTDESGGRTELVRTARDLGPATASIADELSQQYSIGYTSSRPKDGRWHTIRVEAGGQRHTVRARRGYMAVP